ncbi:MAG: FCD domain-containing protein [Betaproteobacteria bacterium]|nr:MAG: FCD domain-containing protein [Betaproteobacteria bacterium]
MRGKSVSTVADTDPVQEPKTLVEAAYLRLRRDIIEGVHAPGEKLRVEHLKDTYEVGAGTLREALLLLVTDALVVAQGQRGFRVAPISIADCEDISHTRVLLETEALRQSIARGDDAWEAALVAAFHRLTRAEQKLTDSDDSTTEDWEKCNHAFHEALIAATPSRWIRHFEQILYQQSERYRRISLFRQPITRDIHAEHHALFDAALARDAARASSILSEHILRTLDAVKRLPVDFFAHRG